MHWLLLAFGAFLFIGLSNFGLKYATSLKLDTEIVVFVLILFQLMVAGAVLLFNKESFSFATDWKALLVAAIAGIVLGFGVLALGRAFANPNSQAGVVTLILNLNFILVSVLAFFFLQETLALKQIIGMIIVVGGLLLVI